MKARMKRLISFKSIPILALALLIVLGPALAVGRDPVSISGEVNLGTFTGTATVIIEGEELVGSVQIMPVGGMIPKDGGNYFPEVIHEFTFEDGSILTTTGEEFAMPTDENPAIHTLHGNMEIIPESGTGVFEGVSGELRVNGQMDWSDGQATFNANGTISR